MKKLALFFVILVCFVLTLAGNDLTKMDLREKVREVTENEWSLEQRFGVYEKTIKIYEIFYFYDESGNLITASFFGTEGVLNLKAIYTYNSKGYLINREYYGTDGALMLKWTFVYDNNGNLIEEISYDEHGSINNKTIQTYNNKNQVIESSSYLKDGRFDMKTLYTYNSEGLLNTLQDYDSAGEPTGCIVYAYTKDNKKEIELFYDKNGLLINKRSYYYNGKGDLIETREDGDHYQYAYKYDSNGNWVIKEKAKLVTKFGSTYFEKQGHTEREIVYY